MSDAPVPSPPPGTWIAAQFQAAREHQRSGALQLARQAYKDILAQEPLHVGSLHMLGLILAQTGQPDKGVDLLCRALELDPHNAQTYYGLGFAMCALKEYQGAIACYDKAMALQPQFAEAACDKGSALIELKRCAEAVESFDLAIGWRPDYADAYVYRGNAFMGLQENERAVRSFETGLALNPGFASGHLNLGNALLALRDYEGALASYDRAIALQPDQAMAYSNRSGVLKHLHRFDEALRSGESAIALAPDFAFGHFNYSLLLLLLGDLRAGFEKYHTRWETDTFQVIRRNFPQPLWLGRESLQGLAVLVHTEQGLGDTIQFARYAQVLADRGARVVLEAEPALFTLFQTLPGVHTLLRQGDTLPAFDLYCPLMSVPIGCGTTLATVPAGVPYLHANPVKVAAWQKRLGASKRPRVGLVWSGSMADPLRSLELSALLDALPEGMDYISLQKEIRPGDMAAVQASGMAHYGDDLLSMDDTAALCACMDLVIAVDTSVAHLAGALGLPVWVLLPHMPDWRWLLDRSDSPWYPSARLYRQTRVRDWSAPLAQLRVDLLCHMLELQPVNAQAYYDLGFAMCKLKQFAAGIECFDKAMAQQAQFAEAACDKGSALIELNRCAEAVESFDLAIGWRPDYAEAYVHRGNALMGLQEDALAVQSFKAGLAIKPALASGHLNLGNALLAQGDYEGALASYDRTIALRPQDALAYSNRSGVLKHLHRFDGALRSCESAVALAPDFAFGQWNHSLLLLLMGDLRAGFEKYHWRWKTDTFQVICRNFSQPMWLGQEDLKGQTVLIHTEQGLGDTIQFCRYAPLLAERGARVIFEVEPALYDLLRTLPGVDTLVHQRDPLPAFDLYCPLMSLPIGCGTTLDSVPSAVPYLRTNPAKVWAWQDRLGPKTRPRVGLVWSGSTTHKADHLRSLELSALLNALRDGFDYVSLQKEIRPADMVAVQASGMAHYGDDLLTMDDTAALCACMDLVIAVDTSVAHLAGALGLPVWVLLPHMPDWRWLLDRSDSPWYPSARLYRQTRAGDWNAPLAQVRADLLAGL